MKKSIVYICFILLFNISCQEKGSDTTDAATVEKTVTLQGVWELVSFFNYDDSGNVTDTLKASETNKQVKIYTESKIMWSRFNISDTIDWFGYGSYVTTDTSLTETIEYGSKSMNRAIEDQQNVFDFKLILAEETYSQITIDEDGDPFFAENYRRIEH